MNLQLSSTFLFYDYETFGLHTSLDKPAQFACIRTDMNFNIIDDPKCLYCYFADDYLPDPQSILITGITPQYTQKNGTNEYIFAKKIFNIFKQANTCIVGYNNIHFDDEITRNIFYRNFFDPYEWSWKNGNSRWDVLSLLRACYALRPNGIKWPKNNLGLVSFKLSDITKINQISHLNVHDAMSDVYATISVLKLIKEKQPKLFNFFFMNRRKHQLYKFINLKKFKPIIYVSNYFGVIRYNVSCILPIIWHKNNNILICIDLFKDVKKLVSLCEKISFDDSFIKKLFHLGIVFLYFNRCPMVAPIKSIRIQDCFRLNFNLALFHNKINFLRKNTNIINNIKMIFFRERNFTMSSNVDLQIYSSFFDFHDRKIMQTIRNTSPNLLNSNNYNFHDIRLKMLFFRYRARNFLETLDNSEKKKWLQYCLSNLNPTFLNEYIMKIKELIKQNFLNKEHIILLNNLLDFSIEKYKKLFYQYFNLS